MQWTSGVNLVASGVGGGGAWRMAVRAGGGTHPASVSVTVTVPSSADTSMAAVDVASMHNAASTHMLAGGRSEGGETFPPHAALI
jgi:hypothetical protein